ncbi:hypothetical protein JCGZ_12182 [Jatropha curcas]|uniref:Uncharacterized protein n=1 Tax=Jatropha curcas TaxID=180498 RepID=A0A067KKT7_JATCU|nr:hypothetical protein JCGZ_12182 [Jatropha curcas]
MTSQGNADSGGRDTRQGGAGQAFRSPAFRKGPIAPPRRGNVMRKIWADFFEPNEQAVAKEKSMNSQGNAGTGNVDGRRGGVGQAVRPIGPPRRGNVMMKILADLFPTFSSNSAAS